MSAQRLGKWSGQVVLVTGASSGIGAALAVELAEGGARVGVTARRLDRLEALVARISEAGGEAMSIACDVTDLDAMQSCVDQVIDHWGQLDCVIANAGFGVAGAVMKLSNEDYQRQFDTNIFGVLNTLKVAYPHLKERSGRAVIVGSVNGYVSLERGSAYAMSKFAVRALAQSLWVEWASAGISTTLIEPGFIDSEIRRVNNRGQFKAQAKDPVPPWLMMPAEVAARKICRAIYKRKREVIITAHGQVIVWLARFAPRLTHMLLRRARP